MIRRGKRFQLPEFVAIGNLLGATGLLVLGVQSGWIIAIVPGFSYIVAGGIAYILYKQYQREKALASPALRTAAESREQLKETPLAVAPRLREAGAVAFRVVGASRGACPLGRRVGEIVSINAAGEVTPALCSYGQTVLRLAEKESGTNGVQEWCCPVYDHFLIFRRERRAA